MGLYEDFLQKAAKAAGDQLHQGIRGEYDRVAGQPEANLGSGVQSPGHYEPNAQQAAVTHALHEERINLFCERKRFEHERWFRAEAKLALRNERVKWVMIGGVVFLAGYGLYRVIRSVKQ